MFAGCQVYPCMVSRKKLCLALGFRPSEQGRKICQVHNPLVRRDSINSTCHLSRAGRAHSSSRVMSRREGKGESFSPVGVPLLLQVSVCLCFKHVSNPWIYVESFSWLGHSPDTSHAISFCIYLRQAKNILLLMAPNNRLISNC